MQRPLFTRVLMRRKGSKDRGKSDIHEFTVTQLKRDVASSRVQVDPIGTPTGGASALGNGGGAPDNDLRPSAILDAQVVACPAISRSSNRLGEMRYSEAERWPSERMSSSRASR
jgi:hypothetical protein